MATSCLTRCEARMLRRSSPKPERESWSDLTAISPRLVHSRPRSMRVNERAPCSALQTRFANKDSPGRHPQAVNVHSFLSEVLNAQPTTSTVLAFDPDHRAAPAGADPWWRSDDSLRDGRTVHCLDCRSPDPDRAENPELCGSGLPDPGWADWDFWPMNPHAPGAATGCAGSNNPTLRQRKWPCKQSGDPVIGNPRLS